MSSFSSRRQSLPLAFWLLLSCALAGILASLGLGVLAWQETRRIQTDMMALQSGQQAAVDQLSAMLNTVASLEQRLAAMEAKDPSQQMAALQSALETATGLQEVTDLHAELVRLQNTLEELDSRLRAVEAQGQTADPPPSEVHLAVARQQQSHNLSCEASSISMAAHYFGVPLSEAEALAALPLNDNPHLGFRGNVDGPTGGIQDYGVYAGPVLEVLKNSGLQAWSVKDGLSGIKAALARGNPVIAWVTYDCQPGSPTTVTIDGQAVTLVPYQHVVVVTGYNAQGIWANDPWDGQEDFYGYSDFERAMGYFGNMAIEIAAP